MKQQQKQGGILERLRAENVRAKLLECEWNFDKPHVGEDELIACCYWEYARESAFIRRVVQRLKDTDERKVTKPLVTAGKPWVQTHCLRLLEEAGATTELPALRRGAQNDYSRYYKQMLEAQAAQPESVADEADLHRLYSIGSPVVELFRRLPFPKPWQSVGKTERGKWANFQPKLPTPWEIPPFRVCNAISDTYNTASELYRIAREHLDAQQAVWKRIAELAEQGVARLKESAELRTQLAEQGTHPTPLLVRGIGGVDSFIGQINWLDFTENQIIESFAQWVKTKGRRPVPLTQQPRGVHGLRGGRGKDPQNWRTKLERLGIMRLMHQHKFDELLAIVQATESTESADREKYSVKAECKKERERALADFHDLFPSLPADEKPKSWEQLPGDS